MAKILLLVLGVFLVYWILKGHRRSIDRGSPAPPAAAGEDMVRCAHCGVHLPRSESITTQGRFFCTSEHERAHR